MTSLSTHTLNILFPISLQLHISIPCAWHLPYIPFSTLYVLLYFISEDDISLIFLLTPIWLILYLGMTCILFSLLTFIYFIIFLSMASLLSSLIISMYRFVSFLCIRALSLSSNLHTLLFPLMYSYCLYVTCLIFFLHKFTQVYWVPVQGISLLLASLFYSCSTTILCIICIFLTQWYVCFYFICVHDITLSLYQTIKLTSLSNYCHAQLLCVDDILSFSLLSLFYMCSLLLPFKFHISFISFLYMVIPFFESL